MYKYEFHCHTKEVSACSRIGAAELVRVYHSLGYSGIFITDHFFNGNTTVPRDIAWDKRTELFTRGYEAAKAEGSRLGVQVFFAWEYSYHGTDFLTYGLGADWIYNNPDCLEWRMPEYFDKVHRDGGIIVQAHPYRKADYIDTIRLNPWKTDGVEVFNSSMNESDNFMANAYASHYGLFKTVGSDNHVGYAKYLTAVEFESRQESMEMALKNLINGNCTLGYYKTERKDNGEYVLGSMECEWLK